MTVAKTCNIETHHPRHNNQAAKVRETTPSVVLTITDSSGKEANRESLYHVLGPSTISKTTRPGGMPNHGQRRRERGHATRRPADREVNIAHSSHKEGLTRAQAT